MALLHSFVYKRDKRANIRIPLFALAESCLRRCDVGKRYLSVFALIYLVPCIWIVFERKGEEIIGLDTKNENEECQIISIRIGNLGGKKSRIHLRYKEIKRGDIFENLNLLLIGRCG